MNIEVVEIFIFEKDDIQSREKSFIPVDHLLRNEEV